MVFAAPAWQGTVMRSPSKRSPAAGGILLAIATMLGAFIGATQRQPSAGLLIGLGVGALLALGVWLLDRGRG